MKAVAIPQASSVLILKKGKAPLQYLALFFTERSKMHLYNTVHIAFKHFVGVWNLSCAKVNCICLLVDYCDNSDKSLESLCSSQQSKLRSGHHLFFFFSADEQSRAVSFLCACDIIYD